MKFVYFLLFAAVAIGTRAGIQFLRPLADNDEAWLIGIVLAAAACFVAATYRRKQESPVEEKPEPRFQDTSPYDGGVIVGSAMAANVGLPGMVTLQSNSGGSPSGHSSCGHAADGGGDCGGGGGH